MTEEARGGCDFEAHRPNQETFLCNAGACLNCDDKRSILVSVSREEMLEFFGGYVVFYEAEGGRIGFRTWWQKIGGRLHQPPEAERYFVLRTGFDKKKNDDRRFEGDEAEEAAPSAPRPRERAGRRAGRRKAAASSRTEGREDDRV